MNAVTIVGVKWATMNGSHGNPHAHQALMTQWRNLAIVATLRGSALPFLNRVVVTATVHRTTNAHSDAHNVSPTIKACIDGALKATGVIPDDCDCHITELIIRRGPKQAKPTITLAVERTSGHAPSVGHRTEEPA